MRLRGSAHRRLRAEVRLQAVDTIITRYSGDQVARNIPLTTAGLKRGPQYILDGTLEDDTLALHFDGLKRVEGQSELGEFHYLPVLFHESRQVKKEQKLLLEVYGMILSGLQGRAPAYGIIWHGRMCKATRVKLNPNHGKAEQVLCDLREMAGAVSAPRPLAERSLSGLRVPGAVPHAQAVQEDNISLLRGLPLKEIAKQNKNGVFTADAVFVHVSLKEGEETRIATTTKAPLLTPGVGHPREDHLRGAEPQICRLVKLLCT